MGLDDRYELFGGPTETLAAEAVWGFRREQGTWPLWDEAVQYLSQSQEVAGDLAEAERRLHKAIVAEEALPKLRGSAWAVILSDEMANRIARRYTDATLPRHDKEDTW